MLLQIVSNMLTSDKNKILVVDSDKEFCQNVRLFLEEDYDVYIRQSCNDLNRFIILKRIDLIICEAEFFNKETLVTFENLRNRHPGLKLILMYTYLSDDAEIKEAFTKDVDDLIAKPFRVDVLKKKVELLLRQSGEIKYLSV